MISAFTNFFSAWDSFVNPGMAEETSNAALARAIKDNNCSPKQLDELDDIFSCYEKSQQFFNNPVVQLPLLEGLIANTHMDDRVIAAMQTCLPCVPVSDQKSIFQNQFSWLLQEISAKPSLVSNLIIALRFFTDISSQELRAICANHKCTPYQSTKRPNHHLNGKVKFDNSSNLIECRHLATAVLEELNPINNKISYSKFSNKTKIAQHIKADIETRYEDIKNNATEMHLIKNTYWGRFIASQFEQMHQQKVQTKKMLVESTNHAMAAWLRIKLKDGKTSYIVHFYDPNSTTTHTRAKTYDLASIAKWTIGSFINIESSNTEKHYYPEKQPISFVYIAPSSDSDGFKHQEVQQNRPISENGRKLTSCNVDLDATVIYHLMEKGFPEKLKELQEINLSHTERLNLLAAKRADGTPGLTMALVNGHSNVVKAYSELLQTAGIAGTELLNLLTAKRVDGLPGLYMALANGHADAIRAYAELLKTNAVLGPELLNLLAAKRANGIPGLSVALANGHGNAIRAYGEMLKEMDIPNLELLNLIRAKDIYGAPGLTLALANGCSDAIKAYGELLQTAGITGIELLNLLTAKTDDGTPGLYMALQNGHSNAIRTYGELLQTAGIARTELLNLLTAKTKDGTPGLYMALQDGHTDAIKAYGRLLKVAGISGPELSNLLITKKINRITALHMASQKGHVDAIEAYRGLFL